MGEGCTLNAKLAWIIIAVVATAGCHTFTPTRLSDVTPGQEVRVRVSGAWSDTLSAVLLTDDARVVEGAVIDVSSNAAMLEVPVNTELRGMRMESVAQRIEVPAGEIVDVELKELSKARTFGALGAVGIVLGTLVVSQLNQDSGGQNPPGGGGPEDAIVTFPLLRVPIGLLGGLLGGGS